MKTRPITNHDKRTRGRWGSDRGENTNIWDGMVGGTRVVDPLGADRRCQPHDDERLRQSNLIPLPRPSQGLAGLSGWSPG
jgi:hypothetical protein